MGGDITLSSQVGKGSIFVIDLPLEEGEAQAVQAKEKQRHVLRLQPGQPACRVLIVDDIEDNRQLLAQLLAPVGFEVRLAVNGAEAVKQFEEWRPCLILMDFRMPVMDGHEAIRRIRAMPGGKEPKIIAVTASAMDDNRQELMEIGADDFIGKPFREAELFHKIHAHVGVEYEYADALSSRAPGASGRADSPSRWRACRRNSSTRCEKPSSRRTSTSCSRAFRRSKPAIRALPRDCAAWPRASNTRNCLTFSAQEPRLNPARPDNGTSAAQPASILIVDDTPANLQVLAGMLKDRGYKVRPVPSGKLALAAAQRDPPDLILLDINMPEMNGYEVCEHLKADDNAQGHPRHLHQRAHRTVGQGKGVRHRRRRLHHQAVSDGGTARARRNASENPPPADRAGENQRATPERQRPDVARPEGGGKNPAHVSSRATRQAFPASEFAWSLSAV